VRLIYAGVSHWGGNLKKIKCVVLKISGEALAGGRQTGIDPAAIKNIAGEIKAAKDTGVKLAVVVGGGNIWRGAKSGIKEIDRVAADYMGMLATVINALALQSVLEKLGIDTRVQSAIEISKLCEPFIRRRAMRHLIKGRVLIFAGGTGNPYFTTDTTAALRAVELGADVLLKATRVDGVYDDDPLLNPRAKKYVTLTFMEAIRKRLRVMDTTAFSLCMDNDLPVIVFNLLKSGNTAGAIKGRKVGTVIKN
jgi:uridylate kinase